MKDVVKGFKNADRGQLIMACGTGKTLTSLFRVPSFDLVIADEAHRCAGPVSSDFATVLDPVKIKAQRRQFMTATPLASGPQIALRGSRWSDSRSPSANQHSGMSQTL
jgi:predicted helicase